MNQNPNSSRQEHLQEEHQAPATPPSKKNWLFSLLFLVIAGLTLWAVTSQIKDFSISEFIGYIQSADWRWLALSCACMLCFILFEGMALLVIARGFGYKKSVGQGFLYSAGDIYFSAITPSATGGQPASAYFMIKDGIPGMVTTVALVANLVMYTLAILTIALVCLCLRPHLFFQFGLFSRVLIVVGIAAQILLAIFFVLLLKKEKALHRICDACLRLLAKLHLLPRAEEKRERLRLYMEDYARYAQMLRGHGKALLAAFLFNFFQRALQIAVTAFVYLAAGGAPAQVFDVWVLQGFVVLGSNCVPIPGAMGVSDYLMLDCYGSVLSATEAGHLELLSRSVSFYSCILICGALVLFKFLSIKKRRNRL